MLLSKKVVRLGTLSWLKQSSFKIYTEHIVEVGHHVFSLANVTTAQSYENGVWWAILSDAQDGVGLGERNLRWSLLHWPIYSFNLPSLMKVVWKQINEMTIYSYQCDNAFLPILDEHQKGPQRCGRLPQQARGPGRAAGVTVSGHARWA